MMASDKVQNYYGILRWGSMDILEKTSSQSSFPAKFPTNMRLSLWQPSMLWLITDVVGSLQGPQDVQMIQLVNHVNPHNWELTRVAWQPLERASCRYFQKFKHFGLHSLPWNRTTTHLFARCNSLSVRPKKEERILQEISGLENPSHTFFDPSQKNINPGWKFRLTFCSWFQVDWNTRILQHVWSVWPLKP